MLSYSPPFVLGFARLFDRSVAHRQTLRARAAPKFTKWRKWKTPRFQARGTGPQLGAGHPGTAEGDAGVDFADGAVALRRHAYTMELKAREKERAEEARRRKEAQRAYHEELQAMLEKAAAKRAPRVRGL